MTVHNLEGVKQLEKLGFKRVVLSRELSISEIEYIRKNTDIELEIFIHGALCISYSGQCLFSSMVGNRSGNRGMCAQPCRLPYELYANNNLLDKGFLLSPKDQSALDFLPSLIKNGVDSFKIEGRLKTPEYVATVTRIYRKYIDFVLENINLSDSELIAEIHKKLELKNETTGLSDKEELLQVFNRGNFSSGHFSNEANTNLIYSKKSNNMGLYLGKVQDFKAQKGHITLKLENSLSIGDRISINNENYTVSELMIKNKNFPSLPSGNTVTIGRMKGNISNGAQIYRIESKKLSNFANSTFDVEKELLKIPLDAKIAIKENSPIELTISGKTGFYSNLSVNLKSNICPEKAINSPITKEKIIAQLSKTGNSQFKFNNIEVDLEAGLFIPKISVLNELRRNSILLLEEKVKELYTFDIKATNLPNIQNRSISKSKIEKPKISLLLNILNKNASYHYLTNIDTLYIPYKYFTLEDYKYLLKNLCSKFTVYIYMPTIIKDKYLKTIDKFITQAIDIGIKGFVISHISQAEILKRYNLPMIGNYSLNIYNIETISKLRDIGLSKITPSVELEKLELNSLIETSNLPTELIVYGKTPLMTTNYCFLGKSNSCYEACKKLCKENTKFYLKDRLGFEFRLIPDNTSTITTIFNSKITSIAYKDFNVDSVRIDILDENIEQIQNIINKVNLGERFEGNDYTNGKIK